MSPRPGDAPVVVGIDDTGSADDALDWAAAEAAARGCPLRVVHAIHPPLPADPYGLVPARGGLSPARAEAEQVLARAMARARSVAPDIRVTTRLLPATAVPALLGEARHARLVVLGRRGQRGLRGLLSRSVSAQLIAHAPCPVVVIRASGAIDARSSPPRVVVGVDPASPCAPAVGFAFQAARQRGIPLVAVHAWTPDRPADLEAITAPSALAEALAGRTLERALDRWLSGFTAVPVHTALVRGEPAPALIAQSHGAALLVLGTRGRGQVMGTMRGSVGHAVLRHANGPLAIVRHDTTLTPRSRPSPEHRVIPRNPRWPA